VAQIILGPNLSPNLDGSVKKAAYAFLEKLTRDDTTPGLHIEPIAHSADPRVRTGRVNDMWRALLVKITSVDAGAHYVYLGTFQHDDAIARAKSTVIAINPRNGIAELVEADAQSRPAAQPPRGPSRPKPQPDDVDPTPQPLLETHGVGLDDLTRLGIDRRFAERAVAATTDDELIDALEGAPVWQAEALIDLAAGTTLDDVTAKLQIDLQPTDTAPSGTDDDHLLEALQKPAAQMSFAFVDDDEALRAAIEDEDFGHWRVFLHPEQRELAFRPRSGPVRISGGAGTGKTVVLVHRARHLAKADPQARIVLTTFNRTLAASLRDTLRILDPRIAVLDEHELGAPGVYIASVDAIARRVLVGAEGRLGPGEGHPGPLAQVLGARSQHVRDVTPVNSWNAAVGAARAVLPPDLATDSFLAAEYATVVLPNRITARDAYLRVPRPGRGVRLTRPQRMAVWDVIEHYRSAASAHGSTDFDEKAELAAAYLDVAAADGVARPADHVLVDEAQDLGPTRLRFLRALAAEGADDLFLAEDSQQRIYGQKIVLSRVGINIRGRSRRLTLNYRTTAQNLSYAIGILTGETWTDLDGDEIATTGYRSSRHGPTPSMTGVPTLTRAYDELSTRLASWLDGTVPPETVGILTLSNNQAEAVVRALEERGTLARLVADDRPVESGKVVVMTMHRSKGMEFRKVVLFDVSDEAGYWTAAYRNVPEAERADVELRSRSLLYVAATRARDELAVIWHGSPSVLLPTA